MTRPLRRRRKIDIFRALQSFGGELERPRDNECNRKSDHDCEHDEAHGPIWNFEKWENLRRDLDQQPANYGISHRNLIDVAPLHLGEEIVDLHEAEMRKITVRQFSPQRRARRDINYAEGWRTNRRATRNPFRKPSREFRHHDTAKLPIAH